jgi:hypothetical protein
MLTRACALACYAAAASGSPSDGSRPSQDGSALPLQVVLSYYSDKQHTKDQEALPWVHDVGIPHIVYNKGAEALPADYNSVMLPNVGREAGAYLEHVSSVCQCAPRTVHYN